MNRGNILLVLLRKVHTFLFTKRNLLSLFEINIDSAQYIGQDASELIKQKIESRIPFVVGRLGIELNVLLNYKELELPKLVYCRKYITRQLYYNGWDKNNNLLLCKNAGFFPNEISQIEKFSKLMIQEIKHVDIWGCFYSAEKQFEQELSHTIKIRLTDIDPFLHKNPWSESLSGKKVLVIHPFEKTIISQYKKREFIFENKKILPNFELKTIKAVQSIANSNSEFKDWFEALNSMKIKIKNTDFDIAIIGCGAYSLPLATYIKSLGKSAIYLGGATQILFGIKGKRWEEYPPVASLFNEYWVRPLPEETPAQSKEVEDGCYW